MAQSLDSTAMRQHNRTNVFRYIRDCAPTSRIEISAALELNKATVSSLVDELLSEQYIREIGFGESRGGRKPVILELNPQAAYSIGIDIQITHASAVLSNLKGQVVVHRNTSLNLLEAANVQQTLLDYIENTVQEMNEFVKESPHGIVGIGIALPGMVNHHTGFVHYLPNLEVERWDFAKELESRTHIPALVDNDANCGALAQYRASSVKDLVFINAGIGIGVGIVAHGQIYRGGKGIAGEFGHSTISAMGLQCPCGNYGCWELYASERALARYLKELGVNPKNLELDKDFVQRAVKQADAGDSAYLQAFKQLAMYLGIGIVNVINGLNPGRVFLGGNLAIAGDYLMQDVKQSIAFRTVAVNRSTEVSLSSPDSIVLGAANLVMSKLVFAEP